MNDHVALGYPVLADILVHLGLPAVARERIAEIDRKLSEELDDGAVDIERCASLVLEAAELVADVDPAGFDWSGWNEGDPGEDDGFASSRSE
ncbi:hypothetical protein G6L97_13710 [Agrobacterium tumefaciens]|uniref:hypothetical protein n=1 Tax=Agrobacterium tumefaciens TaxID=358 RepID=UPI0015725126|nr:hypothetical protein [Agrobacterium tumefaciens]NSZ85222.1 DUF3387 domain-containing protein [Agrobacterium tumefaciens]WCA70473.1 hypothetical protein G6L97_13710 [Agrobacterium tumefaciens]